MTEAVEPPISTSKRKKNKTDEPKHKPYAIGITKKQLLLYGVTGILILLLIFAVILPILQGHLHFLVVLSESMKPNIGIGDLVVTVTTQPEDIQVGDVITFKKATASDPNRCITHRVVNIVENNGSISFKTKGDANEEIDQFFVSSSDLIGKVYLSIPYLGYLPHFVRTPLGFILLIVVPGTLLTAIELRNLTKSKKKKSNQTKDH